MHCWPEMKAQGSRILEALNTFNQGHEWPYHDVHLNCVAAGLVLL